MNGPTLNEIGTISYYVLQENYQNTILYHNFATHIQQRSTPLTNISDMRKTGET